MKLAFSKNFPGLDYDQRKKMNAAARRASIIQTLHLYWWLDWQKLSAQMHNWLAVLLICMRMPMYWLKQD